MGGLTGGGGGKSGNHAWDEIKKTYYPQAKSGVQGFNQFSNALGIGGDFGAQQQAYDNFLNNSGYKYVLDQGMQGVTNSAAGKYLLRSGSTAKGLQDRSLNIGKTFFENYLDRLAQQSGLGLQAGNLMANAGQYSKGGGGGGLGSLLGAGLSAASSAGLFSDRRLKTKIERIGDWDGKGDGLGRYRFAYKSHPDIILEGVMADEVETLRPHALGEPRHGYATVNYGAL